MGNLQSLAYQFRSPRCSVLSVSSVAKRFGQMINKIVDSVQAAVADIHDGATVMIGGFGGAGQPAELIDGLIAQGARDLTIVNNNAGNGEVGLAALLKARR